MSSMNGIGGDATPESLENARFWDRLDLRDRRRQKAWLAAQVIAQWATAIWFGAAIAMSRAGVLEYSGRFVLPIGLVFMVAWLYALCAAAAARPLYRRTYWDFCLRFLVAEVGLFNPAAYRRAVDSLIQPRLVRWLAYSVPPVLFVGFFLWARSVHFPYV